MPDSAGLEALFVRLYLDRHIMPRLAVDLRGHGYDVVTTADAGKDTASDAEQLTFATTERRTILTFNIRDFAPLHQAWQTAGRPHAGIIVSQQLGSRQYGILLQRMLRFLNHFTAQEMVSNFVHWNNSNNCRGGRADRASEGRAGGRQPPEFPAGESMLGGLNSQAEFVSSCSCL